MLASLLWPSLLFSLAEVSSVSEQYIHMFILCFWDKYYTPLNCHVVSACIVRPVSIRVNWTYDKWRIFLLNFSCFYISGAFLDIFCFTYCFKKGTWSLMCRKYIFIFILFVVVSRSKAWHWSDGKKPIEPKPLDITLHDTAVDVTLVMPLLVTLVNN